MKHKWAEYYLFASNGTENVDANPNDIAFTIKDTKLYDPEVTLLVKDNQKLSKHLSKGSEISIY